MDKTTTTTTAAAAAAATAALKTTTTAKLLLIGSGCMGKIRASVIHCNPNTTLCGIVDDINYDSAFELAELYMVSLMVSRVQPHR